MTTTIVTDPTMETSEEDTPPAAAEPTAAERAATGELRLAELQAQIQTARAAEAAVAGEQQKLDAGVEARERALAAAEAAVEQAEHELLAVRAKALLGVGSEDDAAKQHAYEAALSRCSRAVDEAKEAAEAAERLRAAEAPILEAKRTTAAAKVRDLEQLAGAVQTAIQDAHTEAGQDMLRELRQRHGALLQARNAAMEAYSSAAATLRGFYAADLPDQLADWPALQRLERDEQVGRGLTAEREVVECFILLLNALEANAYATAASVGRRTIYNDASLVGLLSSLNADIARDLYFTSGLNRQGELLQMRAHAERILARQG